MKKYFKRSLILLFVGMFVPIGIYLTGCAKVNEEGRSKGNENLEYLSISKSSLSKMSLTENEKKTFYKAIQRIDKYMVLTNKVFILNVKSGNEIGMSEDLFEYCNGLKDTTNKLIAKQELTVYGGKLYANKVLDEDLVSVPRLKSGVETSTNFYTQPKWFGQASYLSLKAIINIKNVSGGVAATSGSVAAGLAYTGVGTVPSVLCGIIAAAFAPVAWAASAIQDYYPNGIIVYMTNDYKPFYFEGAVSKSSECAPN